MKFFVGIKQASVVVYLPVVCR